MLVKYAPRDILYWYSPVSTLEMSGGYIQRPVTTLGLFGEPYSTLQLVNKSFVNITKLHRRAVLPNARTMRIAVRAHIAMRDPDSKVHGANMGPIWGRQDPGEPMLAPWSLLSGEI